MRTLEAGSKGFTLLELLVVLAIMAVATAGVGLAMRDSSQSRLEREGQRLGGPAGNLPGRSLHARQPCPLAYHGNRFCV